MSEFSDSECLSQPYTTLQQRRKYPLRPKTASGEKDKLSKQMLPFANKTPIIWILIWVSPITKTQNIWATLLTKHCLSMKSALGFPALYRKKKTLRHENNLWIDLYMRIDNLDYKEHTKLHTASRYRRRQKAAASV